MGIVERKLREKEQRVQEILNAARVLFVNKGYGNTTMLDIAEESELSRRTIYLYFKSKEELTFRVMKDAYAHLLDRINGALDNCGGTAFDKLVAMKEAYLDFYEHDFDQLLFILISDLRLNPEDMTDDEAQACMAAIKSIMNTMVQIINEGQKDKSIALQEDPVKSASAYMTMIQSTMQKLAVRKEWFMAEFSVNDTDIVEEMFRVIFHSLKPA
ncbi:MAG: TetR/AcrR family transcriptional regulator [Spirochaetales bacterium]|nr:TetR/AcrR family transcriptional regulator [Spirochaetales bacterium]